MRHRQQWRCDPSSDRPDRQRPRNLCRGLRQRHGGLGPDQERRRRLRDRRDCRRRLSLVATAGRPANLRRLVLLGLDVGTAGASAVAIDETGAVVASAFSGYAIHAPRPGWIEQDPDDWWRAATHVLAVVAAGNRGEVDALGLTGQPGCVFVDA